MSIKNFLQVALTTSVLILSNAEAQISPLETDLGNSYYYTDHYEVVIEEPLKKVWPLVLKMGTWMPWVASDEGNPSISEGDVINLYDDFYIEVAKIIPESMILLVNLPNSQAGEDTQGVAMITVKEAEGRTVVSLFMSRIYYWFWVKENVLRDRRATAEFEDSRRDTFKENFLTVLKNLAEENDQ